ncbi:histone methyltransferase [Hanseniaspora uvarum]|nr:histone methyltransferase [Hanseniaspora uvarum]
MSSFASKFASLKKDNKDKNTNKPILTATLPVVNKDNVKVLNKESFKPNAYKEYLERKAKKINENNGYNRDQPTIKPPYQRASFVDIQRSKIVKTVPKPIPKVVLKKGKFADTELSQQDHYKDINTGEFVNKNGWKKYSHNPKIEINNTIKDPRYFDGHYKRLFKFAKNFKSIRKLKPLHFKDIHFDDNTKNIKPNDALIIYPNEKAIKNGDSDIEIEKVGIMTYFKDLIKNESIQIEFIKKIESNESLVSMNIFLVKFKNTNKDDYNSCNTFINNFSNAIKINNIDFDYKIHDENVESEIINWVIGKQNLKLNMFENKAEVIPIKEDENIDSEIIKFIDNYNMQNAVMTVPKELQANCNNKPVLYLPLEFLNKFEIPSFDIKYSLKKEYNINDYYLHKLGCFIPFNNNKSLNFIISNGLRVTSKYKKMIKTIRFVYIPAKNYMLNTEKSNNALINSMKPILDNSQNDDIMNKAVNSIVNDLISNIVLHLRDRVILPEILNNLKPENYDQEIVKNSNKDDNLKNTTFWDLLKKTSSKKRKLDIKEQTNEAKKIKYNDNEKFNELLPYFKESSSNYDISLLNEIIPTREILDEFIQYCSNKEVKIDSSRLIKKYEVFNKKQSILMKLNLNITIDSSILPPPSQSTFSLGFKKVSSELKETYLPYKRQNGALKTLHIHTGDLLINEENIFTTQFIQKTSSNIDNNRNNRSNIRRLQSNLQDNTNDAINNLLSKRKKSVMFAKSSIHNWGLYTQEPILSNEMIIEYVGEVLRQSVSEKRERDYLNRGIGSSYLFRIDENTVIDATKIGGIARFINHSCDPNCTAKIIKVGKSKRIVIYALRDIMDNEELTYDYKFEREINESERVKCLCGAYNCKGYLN